MGTNQNREGNMGLCQALTLYLLGCGKVWGGGKSPKWQPGVGITWNSGDIPTSLEVLYLKN